MMVDVKIKYWLHWQISYSFLTFSLIEGITIEEGFQLCKIGVSFELSGG